MEESPQIKVEGGDPDPSLVAALEEAELETVLKLVGEKLFDSYSIWDLMMVKANKNRDWGAMEAILHDTSHILQQLKTLLEGCLRPVRVNQWTKYQFGKEEVKKKKRRKRGKAVEIDEMLSLALCVDAGEWKIKDKTEIQYENSILNIDYLFPDQLDMEDEEDEDQQELEDTSNYNMLNESEEEESDYDPVDDDEDFLVPEKKKQSKTKKEPKGKKGAFQCEKCKRLYKTIHSLNSHIENVCANKVDVQFKEELDRFYCLFDSCSNGEVGFESRLAVENHWANEHVPDEEKIIPCYLCQQKFATANAKREHMSRDHTKSYQCEVCSETFLLESQLNKHLQSHEEAVKKEDNVGNSNVLTLPPPFMLLPERSYLCLKCGQAMTPEYGKKHEANCDGQRIKKPEFKVVDKLFVCTAEGCNLEQGFKSVSLLLKHFHENHVKEGDKTFDCEYCGKRFTLQAARNKHVKLIHVKSYTCDICGKSFASKEKVTRHRYTHTGEKPHACDICDYRSTSSYNLNRHKTVSHGQNSTSNKRRRTPKSLPTTPYGSMVQPNHPQQHPQIQRQVDEQEAAVHYLQQHMGAQHGPSLSLFHH